MAAADYSASDYSASDYSAADYSASDYSAADYSATHTTYRDALHHGSSTYHESTSDHLNSSTYYSPAVSTGYYCSAAGPVCT
jgi:hypothetical protein